MSAHLDKLDLAIYNFYFSSWSILLKSHSPDWVWLSFLIPAELLLILSTTQNTTLHAKLASNGARPKYREDCHTLAKNRGSSWF